MSDSSHNTSEPIIPKIDWGKRCFIILDKLNTFKKIRKPQSVNQLLKEPELRDVAEMDIRKLVKILVQINWIKPALRKTKKKSFPRKKKKSQFHYPLTPVGLRVLKTISDLRKDHDPLVDLYIFDGIGDFGDQEVLDQEDFEGVDTVEEIPKGKEDQYGL